MLSTTLVLPRIASLSVDGFEPIFQSKVELNARQGISIILGGNGLGKTTLMQALIYGLTGGVSEDIEEEKRYRWGHAYFRSRLSSEKTRVPEITVSFFLGKERIYVRRGLSGSHITGLRSSTAYSTWLDNRDVAARAFAGLLRDFGGYSSVEDFAFIVHRLVYLPESRRLLAWDTNAQTRILMLLNRDLAQEGEFREKRERLKRLDSRKRHIHVQLGHAEKALIAILDEPNEDDSLEVELASSQISEDAERLPSLMKELTAATKARIAASDQLQVLSRTISGLANDVDDLQASAEAAEAEMINSLLGSEERESGLAIYKLLDSGICPCCGTKQKDLQAAARQYQREQKCVLCGSDNSVAASANLSAVRSQLAEKVRALQANEEAHRSLQQKFADARSFEDELLGRINVIRFSEPVTSIPDNALTQSTRLDLERRKAYLETTEADLALQLQELQADLEQEYNRFLLAVAQRMVTLKTAYENYASAFLGIPCQLVPERDEDRLLDLTAFIPEFNGAPRPTADSCSEAQRFFLDIAFRMAILDLASDLSGHTTSFVCETPENALDLSYLDNVAKMFESFVQKRHSVILSANIQENSLAARIMSDVAPQDRKGRVVNLLDIGQLTTVQRGSLTKLRNLARKVTG